MGRKNKGGKELAQTKDQTPLLPLSGTRKVVRTPTNPFEATGTVEVFVPKEIIARRIQDIFAGSSQASISDGLLEPCVRSARAAILRDLQQRWIEDIDDNVQRILCIGAMLDPHFKTIKDTAPEFTEHTGYGHSV